MLHHTRGIVLGFVRFRETSIIAKIYTEKFGLQSYIINGVRSSKSKGKIALYQPLTVLELVVYHHGNRDIERLSEARCFYPFSSLPFEIRKSTISIFMAEVIAKCIREQEPNSQLYPFLENKILLFDQLKDGIENFHLRFLLNLMQYLGFKPSGVTEMQQIFESEGFQVSSLSQNGAAFLKLLFEQPSQNIETTRRSRKEVLLYILNFYKVHIDHFGEIKSLPVLQEVLS